MRNEKTTNENAPHDQRRNETSLIANDIEKNAKGDRHG
jgi:hypothetical protein